MSDTGSAGRDEVAERPPSEIPSYIRTTGVMALGWAAVATALHLSLLVKTSVPGSVFFIYRPGFEGIAAQTTQWSGPTLNSAAWICLGVFVAVVLTGIALAAPRRWWILVVCALATITLVWASGISFLGVALQLGPDQAADRTPHSRVAINIAALSSPVVVIATMFMLPSWVSARRRSLTDSDYA